MGFKLFSRQVNQRIESKKQTKASVFERLEERALLAAAPPVITSYTADNRGQVILQFSQKMDINTIGRSSVHLLGVGADGLINTADDTALPVTLILDRSKAKLFVTATVAADANYRIKLSGSIIKGVNGVLLDGEFNGSAPSGNGTPGGDFQFRAKRASLTTTHPLALIQTNEGDITLQLFQDLAPNTVANFKQYADAGTAGYDGTIFFRNNTAEYGTTTTGTGSSAVTTTTAPPYQFLEAAGFASDGTPVLQLNSPANREITGLSNERGTIATATGAVSTNNSISLTSAFIFNISDNHKLNPNNGFKNVNQIGTSVFGNVVSGMSVLITIFKLPTVAFTTQDNAKITYKGAPQIANFDGSTARVILGRVAILDRAVAI